MTAATTPRTGRSISTGWMAIVALAAAVAACSSDGSDSATGSSDAVAVGQPPTIAPADTVSVDTTPTDATPAGADTITLVAYDSFPEADTSLNDALASFTEQTGVDVEILIAGDTGTMLSKASLTAGNPEGDVMWGIDNTLLSRAIDDGVFEPYLSLIHISEPTRQ